MKFLLDDAVRVYRALPGVYSGEHRMYTVEQRGNIIGQVPALTLRNVTFHVDAVGRKESRRATRKLHAWAQGVLELAPLPAREYATIDYNPWASVAAFMSGDRWVKGCAALTLDSTGCRGSGVDYLSDDEIALLKRKS